MSKSRRLFSREFKLQLVREAEAGTSTVAELARRHEVHPNLIQKWVKQYHANGDEAFRRGSSTDSSADAKITELEQAIGQLTMENRFLKRLLRRLETVSQTEPSGPR